VTLTTAALPGAIDPIDGTTSYYPMTSSVPSAAGSAPPPLPLASFFAALGSGFFLAAFGSSACS